MALFISVAVAACGLLALVIAGGAWAVAWFSIHPFRVRGRGTPADFGPAFEAIEFQSRDGTRLSGWLVPAQCPAAILILAHGMAADRSQMLPWAERLWAAGYTLILFDFRALGRSGGNLCTMGLMEAEDLLAAVDYIEER